MNFKVTLLLLVCLFQIFHSITTSTSEVQGKVSSERYSLSLRNLFRSIDNKWKKAKKKSAEKKFLEQVQRRSRLEEAARIKAEKRRISYETATKTTLTDLLVLEKWSLKKGYHYWLWRRARRAKSKWRKLIKKHEDEEFCDFRKKGKNKRRKEKKTKEETDVCEIAFKNSYFEEAKLTYTKSTPYACQNGKVFIKDTGTAETMKYQTKFKTCVATKEENGFKSQVSVFIKKSDKQKKGGKLKFFVLFAEENRPAGDLMQMTVDLLKGENKVYKVAAYLKNGWF